MTPETVGGPPPAVTLVGKTSCEGVRGGVRDEGERGEG